VISRLASLLAGATLLCALALPALAATNTGGCGEKILAPATATYAAALADDGALISPANALGPAAGWGAASLAVALPSVASLGAKPWTVCGTSDNNRAVVFNAPTLAAAAAPALSQTTGGSLVARTYYVAVTLVNLGGETVPSADTTFAAGVNNRLVVASPASSGNATGWNLYVGTSAGNKTKQNASPLLLGSNWTEPLGGLIAGASPPTVNSAPSAYILDGGRVLATYLVGGSDYQTATLSTDGANYRVVSASAETRLHNGATTGFPARTIFPSGPGYQATQADNGYAITSGATSSGLTVTLPPTTSIAAGWTVRLNRDGGRAMIVQVNGTSGGAIAFPGGTKSSIELARYDYEYLILQYDGAVYRVIGISPASATFVGLVGASIGIPTNAALALTNSADYPTGVWRLDYSSGYGAAPLFFVPQTGTCAANGRVNNGGGCVNDGDGNSWLAKHPNDVRDTRQYGIPLDSTASVINDAAPMINAALADCTADKGGKVLLPSVKYNYVISSDIIVPVGCRLSFASPLVWAQVQVVDMDQPAIYLDPARTIRVYGELVDFAIFQRGLYAPATVQQTWDLMQTFAGTAISLTNPPQTVNGGVIQNGMIVGFNQCINVDFIASTRIDQLAIFCNNGIRLNDVHDIARITRVHGWAFLTGADQTLQHATMNVSAVGDNGSGQYRLTVDTTANLKTGQPLIVRNIRGQTGANGKWIATVVDATHIDLQGSATGGVTKALAGTWVGGQTALQLADLNGVWFGMAVAGAGIAPGTKIRSIDFSRRTIWVDKQTTAPVTTGQLITLTSAGPYLPGVPGDALQPGGLAQFFAAYHQLGDFISVSRSEQVNFSDTFHYGYNVGYRVGAFAVWSQFFNAGCDGMFDPYGACVLLEDNPVAALFSGGQLGTIMAASIVDKAVAGVTTFADTFIGQNPEQGSLPIVAVSLQGSGETQLDLRSTCTECGLPSWYSMITVYDEARKKRISGMIPKMDLFPHSDNALNRSMRLVPGTEFIAGSPYNYKTDEWIPQLMTGGSTAGFTYSFQDGFYEAEWPFYTASFQIILNGPVPTRPEPLVITGAPADIKCGLYGIGVVPLEGLNMTGLTGMVIAKSENESSNFNLGQSHPTGNIQVDYLNLTPTSVLRGTLQCRQLYVQR
jgi:hypothetical protein